MIRTKWAVLIVNCLFGFMFHFFVSLFSLCCTVVLAAPVFVLRRFYVVLCWSCPQYWPRDCLGTASPNWPVSCRVELCHLSISRLDCCENVLWWNVLTLCASGLEHSAAEWITTEIEVRIRESHGDDDFVNQAGIIRNISVRLSCTHLSDFVIIHRYKIIFRRHADCLCNLPHRPI